MSNDAANGFIDLDVTTDSLVWTGAASTEWSTNTIPGPKNWKLASNGSATDFLPDDVVVFDDTPATSPQTVDISAADVNPALVTFNNAAVDYLLQGSAGITGPTSLTMNGTGLVTITNTNSFTGAVNFNKGTISVGSLAAGGTNSPLGAGTSFVFGGGQLEYTGLGDSSDRSLTINAGGGTVSVRQRRSHARPVGPDLRQRSIRQDRARHPQLGGREHRSGRLDDQPGRADAQRQYDGRPLDRRRHHARRRQYRQQRRHARAGQRHQLRRRHGLRRRRAAIGNDHRQQSRDRAGHLRCVGAATSINFHLVADRAVTIAGALNQVVASISGPGAGAGNDTLIFNPGSGQIVFTSDGTPNTFTGNVHIESGSVQMQNISYIANDAAHQNLIIPDTSSMTVDFGATWKITHGVETIDALNGAGIVQNTGGTNYLAGAATLTLGGGNGSGSFSGTMQDGGTPFSLALIGTGTQTLSGAGISYTGPTTVAAGTLDSSKAPRPMPRRPP